MNNLDSQYIALLENVLKNGNVKSDRTGTGTKSIFGAEIRVNLQEGFPILTTKSVHFKSVVGELLWILSGSTNIKFLKDNNIKIWDAWSTDRGGIGPMYGAQWRNFNDVDQIAELIHGLKTNPDSRRHVVSAWNPGDLPLPDKSPQQNVALGYMALAPCHYSFQCYVNDGKLSMLVNQRSADLFLGVPFNIASYALLTHMLAQITGLQVGELIWRGGDVHIYSNHELQVRTQIRRYENGLVYPLPKVWVSADIDDIDEFEFRDIGLEDYLNAGRLTAKVAV